MADFFFSGTSRLRDLASNLRLKAKRKKTLLDVMTHAVNVGENTAKRSAPVLTGLLRSQITGRVEGEEQNVKGWIEIDLNIVPYARRQNFEHKAHAHFMEKGTLAIEREVLKYWEDSDNVEEYVFNE